MTVPRASWIRNWADTDEPGADPAPLELSRPPAEAMSWLVSIIETLPRWRVETTDTSAGTLTATRRTRLFRFVDDIALRLEPTATGTRLHARSQSRVGRSDFGQNRRNLHELFRALTA